MQMDLIEVDWRGRKGAYVSRHLGPSFLLFRCFASGFDAFGRMKIVTDALYTTLYIMFLGIRMTPSVLGVATWQCRRRVFWTGTGVSWMVRMRVCRPLSSGEERLL